MTQAPLDLIGPTHGQKKIAPVYQHLASIHLSQVRKALADSAPIDLEDCCEICGEPGGPDSISGDWAEMFDPNNPDTSVDAHITGHWSCGEWRGFKLA